MTEPNGIEARLSAEWRDLMEAVSLGPSPLDLPPERRRAFSRVALFAQLEEVREEWRALHLTLDAAATERFANAAWTMKDLLAHLASWAREFRIQLETAVQKKAFDYVIPFAFSVMGPTEWNEKEVQARKGKSLDEIFDEFERETVRMQDLLEGMSEPELFGTVELPLSPTGDPSQKWTGPLGFVIAAKCIHDRHHLGQIRDRLRRFHE